MATTCKACGAPLIWVETPKGKYIPCDEGLIPYKQDRAGKKAVVTDKGEVIKCETEFEGEPTGMARVPHWATCPQADRFRRPR